MTTCAQSLRALCLLTSQRQTSRNYSVPHRNGSHARSVSQETYENYYPPAQESNLPSQYYYEPPAALAQSHAEAFPSHQQESIYDRRGPQAASYSMDQTSRQTGGSSRNRGQEDPVRIYGHQRTNLSNSQNSRRNSAANGIGLDEDDPETSRWIHRDKLALIESQELQQAGIQLPTQAVSRSKSGRSRERSHDRQTRSTRRADRHPIYANGQKQQRMGSSSPPQDQVSSEDEPMSYDLRTPEEIAANICEDGSPRTMYHQPGLKASSSRIPLSTSSPMPVPQEHIERNAPLTRSRGASGNWVAGEDDGILYNRTRSRSHSVGSQILLDDGESPSTTPAQGAQSANKGLSPISPAKARASSGTTPGSGRRTSATNRYVSHAQKPRSISTTSRSSPAQRPATRSGGEVRPATAINRPEGEPPWLAEMFKPDPRLPPEQQLLPTHAKRLYQEQLEREAKLRPSADQGFAQSAQLPNGAQSRAMESEKTTDGAPEPHAGWPLRTASNETDGGGNRPSGSEHGGYSTIPKIRSPPPIGTAPSPNIVQRPMQLEDFPKAKKKTCGCCIVM